MSLTIKQQKFILEYLIDFNATQACIRAGYSPKTARVIGAQNLAKVSIRQEVEAALSESCMLKVEALSRLAKIAREGGPRQLRALELILRAYGAFNRPLVVATYSLDDYDGLTEGELRRIASGENPEPIMKTKNMNGS